MCSFKTKRQSHYLKHLKYHEKQPKLYHCKLCDFKTIRNGELRKHEVNHSGNVIACSLCKYVTDDQVAMNRHKRLKHGDKHFVRDHYVCLICKFKSVTLKKLEKHMQQHKSPEDEHVSLTMQYSCDICPYKTKRKEHLIRHKNVHSDHRPYLCDTCGQKFKRTDALTQHKLVHVDKQNRKYGFKCTKCNKGFRSQSHLQEHMAIHSTEKHFLCDICGAAFKTKSSQQKHIKNLHQSPRSFACQTCDKKFNTNYTLKRHERTHELLPYQKANNSNNVLVGQEFLNQTEVTVTPQDLVQVQDIIAPGIEETYDTTTDKLQQAFSSLNNENSTAIMYLSSSLPASWT
ncbi:hypothetical protein FSP39_011865 [Pinctada imbricata]|uniref:C2H2-type domain-containing protein n=1 Tax=Pinctada imbricata TaxID=66713 RepID=A0AA88YIW6_PINIB|nr:hypothetical protein FSP39_011865 [Pinctada imbricata]